MMMRLIKRLFFSEVEVINIEEPIELTKEEQIHKNLIDRIERILSNEEHLYILRSEVTKVYLLRLHYSTFNKLTGRDTTNANEVNVIISVGDYFGEGCSSSRWIFNRLMTLIDSGNLNPQRLGDINTLLDMFDFYLFEGINDE